MESDVKVSINLTRARVVCKRIVIADRAGRGRRGLLRRGSLAPGEGMLLRPARSTHTAFMRFPIDVVLIDVALRVTKNRAMPATVEAAAARRSSGVVELAAGEAKRRGIAIGVNHGRFGDPVWPRWDSFNGLYGAIERARPAQQRFVHGGG